MAFLAALSEHSDKTRLSPSTSRFTAKIGLHGAAPALHLAAFDRQVGIGGALVTGHHYQFETEGFLKKSGKIVRRGAEAGRGALGWLCGITQVQQSFVGCIRPDIENPIRLFRRTDPAVPKPIELDFFLA